jgi:hypothetical protein
MRQRKDETEVEFKARRAAYDRTRRQPVIVASDDTLSLLNAIATVYERETPENCELIKEFVAWLP